MKHLIICNKASGNVAAKEAIEKEFLAAFEGLDYEVHFTTAPREAISFLKDYFAKNTKDTVRVYAVGGDGTVHEVVNGIAGVKNAELAIYAAGTGNDFVKVYGGKDKFLNFKKLIEGKAAPIDLSKISGPSLEEPWYSINVINIGFDAMVGAKGNENKLKGKKNPYGFTQAIVPAIFHGRFNKGVVTADGKPLNEKKFLLGSIAQGRCIGGEYWAAPKSDNTDGLIDVCVCKPMSLFRLLIQFFGVYHDGKHLDDPRFKKFMNYVRANNVKIEAPADIDVCVDGEMIRGKSFEVESCPKAIKLVIPE